MLGRVFQPARRKLIQTQLQSAEALKTNSGSICLAANQRELCTAGPSSDAEPETKAAATPPRDPAKLSYTHDLRKLRKQWQEQQAQQLAQKAKRAAVKDANKAKSVEAHRQNVATMKELRIQINEEKRRLQVAELVNKAHAYLAACTAQAARRSLLCDHRLHCI